MIPWSLVGNWYLCSGKLHFILGVRKDCKTSKSMIFFFEGLFLILNVSEVHRIYLSSFYNKTQNTLDSFLNLSVDFLNQTLHLLSSQSKTNGRNTVYKTNRRLFLLWLTPSCVGEIGSSLVSKVIQIWFLSGHRNFIFFQFLTFKVFFFIDKFITCLLIHISLSLSF